MIAWLIHKVSTISTALAVALSVAEILLSNLSSKLRDIRVKEAIIVSLEKIVKQRRF